MLLPQRELGARDSALAWSWSRDGSGGSAPPGSERLAIPVPHQRRSPALCAFPPAPGAPYPLSRLTWHPRRGHQSPPSGRRSEASPGWRDGRSRAARRPCPSHRSQRTEQVRSRFRPVASIPLAHFRGQRRAAASSLGTSGHSRRRFSWKPPKGSFCGGAKTAWQKGSCPRMDGCGPVLSPELPPA